MFARRVRKHIRARSVSGAALVELSVVFGLVLLFMAGVLDVGRAIEMRTRLNRVAYEAMRFGIGLEGWNINEGVFGWCRPGVADDTPCPPNEVRVRARLLTLLNRMALPGPSASSDHVGAQAVSTVQRRFNVEDDATSSSYFVYTLTLSVPFTGFYPAILPVAREITVTVSGATLFRDDLGYGAL